MSSDGMAEYMRGDYVAARRIWRRLADRHEVLTAEE